MAPEEVKKRIEGKAEKIEPVFSVKKA